MTDLNLTRLRALADAATQGDFIVSRETPSLIATQDGRISVSWSSTDGHQDEKAIKMTAYIAAANPQTMKNLLDLLDEMAGGLNVVIKYASAEEGQRWKFHFTTDEQLYSQWEEVLRKYNQMKGE